MWPPSQPLWQTAEGLKLETAIHRRLGVRTGTQAVLPVSPPGLLAEAVAALGMPAGSGGLGGRRHFADVEGATNGLAACWSSSRNTARRTCSLGGGPSVRWNRSRNCGRLVDCLDGFFSGRDPGC